MAIFEDLPENLLWMIVSKLFLRDVLSFNLTSKYFKSLALPTKVNHLNLTDLSCNTDLGNIEQIVDNILMCHSGRLQAFEFRNTRSHSFQKIHEWICWACSHHRGKELSHLTLSVGSLMVGNTRYLFKVPYDVFSCESLEYLFLEDFYLGSLPEHFMGFKHLVTCNLSSITLHARVLKQLLEACPNMENLVMDDCREINCVNINAPKLISLELVNMDLRRHNTLQCPRLSKIIFRDCVVDNFFTTLSRQEPLLSVKEFSVIDWQCWGLTLAGVLAKFPNIEHLEIDSYCFVDEVELRLIPPPKQLKRAAVSVSLDEGDEWDIDIVSYLLQTCPMLQVMSITNSCKQFSYYTDFSHEEYEMALIENVLGAERASARVRILLDGCLLN